MKHLIAFLLTLLLAFGSIAEVNAQAAGTIWMETSQQSYNLSDTITVTIKANNSTPVQGFSFQLRYDPACFQPSTPASLISGLNYMSVPQTPGLVDAIFASTSQLNANGALAEVQFKPLAACQTSLKLENAGLAVLDASGMAVPLPGISIGTGSLSINVGRASASQPTSAAEANPTSAAQANATPVPVIELTPSSAPASTGFLKWLLMPTIIFLSLIFIVGLTILIWILLRRGQPSENSLVSEPKVPVFIIKRGSQAGTTLPLVRIPCRIGSDPDNEICLSDTHISPLHAEIFVDQFGYYIADMGSQAGTNLNGRLIRNQQVRLKSGDVLRLGGILLVFNLA